MGRRTKNTPIETKTPNRRSHQRMVSCFLDVSCTYKPGDQAPTGYNNWHEWASVQHKAGLRQQRCGKCSLMKYPQELSGQKISMQATTQKYGGQTVTLTWPVCNSCAANDKLTERGRSGASELTTDVARPRSVQRVLGHVEPKQT